MNRLRLPSWVIGTSAPDEQHNTLSHYLLLVLFVGLCLTSLPQFFGIIAGLVILTALVRGPLLLVWGMVYSALVALFPPLGLLLSLLLILLNLTELVKSWRTTAVALYFYLLPLVGRVVQAFITDEARWQVLLVVAGATILLHLLLRWLHNYQATSRALLRYIAEAPYQLLLVTLPTRFKHWKRRVRAKRS